MLNVLKDNQNLRTDNEEKAKTIIHLDATCSELEQKTSQLQTELSKTVSKVQKLEMKIREEKSKSTGSLPKKSLSVQTAVQCPLMSDKMCDNFLRSVGQSDSVDVMKEEIYTLLLTIEQKDKEVSDLEQELSSLQSHLEEIESQNNKFPDKDIDDFVERNDLRDRLALSCQVNHELMDHLRKLETFMEDMLQHKNMDSSSIENISETSDIFSRLTTCLDETKMLSTTLSHRLSYCENSKLLDTSDTSVKEENDSHLENQSYPEVQSRLSTHSNTQGRDNFFQSESSKNTAVTGKRRLSFSTLHNAAHIDSENIVVLGTSNNEDLILLLNEKGDPEDVLIRNNHSQVDKNPSEFDGQLPRPSSMGFWNQDNRWCASAMLKLQNPSSDSDIWSEPDRDVSLQRIGIDIQKSPVAQKSPRRLRLRDKRTTDELSSQKNESSSSAVRFHSWSKRRKSIETFKSPFVCKKCMSPSKDDSAEKDQLQKVINDLSNKCSKQENQLEEIRENLDSKTKEIELLNKEKIELSNSIDTLEKELKELKMKERKLTLHSSESTGNLTNASSENIKLNSSTKLLETKASESDSIYKKLKEELEETKVRLQNLEIKCSKYEVDLSSTSKTLEEYKEMYNKAVNEKDELENEIQELALAKNELLQSVNNLEKELKMKDKKINLHSFESFAKLTEVSSENVKLKNSIQLFETKASESDSIYKKLKEELEETKVSLQNLDIKCSKYEVDLSSTSKTLEEYKEKYNKVMNEKDELENEIQELALAKSEHLQSIQKEKKKIELLENENSELKRKLEKKSQSITSLQSQYEKLKNKSTELLKEKETKDKLQNEVQELVLEKNELLQSNHQEKKKIKQLENENGELKENLEKKSQSIASLQSQYAELKNKSTELLKEKESKDKLQNEVQELVLAKSELLQSNHQEKNKIKQLENENGELKENLEKKSQSITSLQSQYAELENKSSELLKEKETKDKLQNGVQELVSAKNKLLQSNHQEKKKIKQNENGENLGEKKPQSIKSLQSQYVGLENKSSEWLREKETKENISESLLEVKNLFMDNLQSLRDVFQQYLNCEDVRCKDIDTYLSGRRSTIADDSTVIELFTDINTVGAGFEQAIEFLSDQLTSVSFIQQKYEMKDIEIQSLEKQITQLNAHIKTLQLTEGENKSLIKKSKSQSGLLQKELSNAQEEIKMLNSSMDAQKAHIDSIQQSLKDREKSLEQSRVMLSSSESKHTLMQKQIGKDRNLLNSRDEQISELQNKLLKTKFELNDALLQQVAIVSQTRMNSSQLLGETVSALDPSKSSPNVSTASETTIRPEVTSVKGSCVKQVAIVSRTRMNSSQLLAESVSALDPSKGSLNIPTVSETTIRPEVPSVKGSCESIDKSISSVTSSKDEESVKNYDKYIKKIKSLKTKLAVAEERINILEKEKNVLREELLAQVKRNRTTSQSSDELDNLRKDLADMKEKLQAKSSFIIDLKSEMFKTCNSLVDKQSEINDLKRKLSDSTEQCTEVKLRDKEEGLKFRYSDPPPTDTETNIKMLKRRKWELIQNILKQQKQFYERKNIHLVHLEKFKTHIEKLHAIQESPTIFKSEPLLNSFTAENSCCAEKCNKALKNLQVQLEVDVECLQNFNIFFKRFFIPLVLQSCEHCTKNFDMSPKHSTNELEKSASISAKILQNSKVLSNSALRDFRFSSTEIVRHGSDDSFNNRLISTASALALKIDSMDSILKSVRPLLDNVKESSSIEETPKRIAATSLLEKLSGKIGNLQEKTDEVLRLNGVLKSFGLINTSFSLSQSKQDMSDRESLSEEAINLSRSGSLSPMSFEESLPFQTFKSKIPVTQSFKSTKENIDSEPAHISSNVAGCSQESIFPRSHFSSPDLGIESDPNHESSAPEQAELEKLRETISRQRSRHESGSKGRGWSVAKVPETVTIPTGSSAKLQVSDQATTNGDLHAICKLLHYELLKKEVQESLVGIKSVLSRTSDVLVKFTSPRKSLEYSTFKAIRDTSVDIEVCLEEAQKLVAKFWIAPCPSAQQLNLLIRQSLEQQEELKLIKEAKLKEERYFNEALARLKQAEIAKEKMEKKISKRLVKTKNVIREAEVKLLEQGSQNPPRIPKYPSDDRTCQKKL